MIKYTVIVIALLLLSGCMYYDYTGAYMLSKYSETFSQRNASVSEIKAIERIVFDVATSCGFLVVERGNNASNEGLFMNRLVARTHIGDLDGENSNMTIYLRKIPTSLSITIRDLDNDYETAFMSKIKSELEKRLSDVVKMENVVFNRLYTNN